MEYEIRKVLKELNIHPDAVYGTGTGLFSKPATIWNSLAGSIVFCTEKVDREVVNKSMASVILTDGHIDVGDMITVLISNPRETFIKILNYCFPREEHYNFLTGVKINNDIHKLAQFGKSINADAEIHPSVKIGHNCVIGKCKIGENTVIHANVIINDCVVIGKNVTIYPSCVIGYEGFGHFKNKNGDLENFPHYGGVIIEDNVEIFPLVNIDRGCIDDTIIGSGSKIDHYCHIGHSVQIGKNCIITACAVIAGSTKIGDWAWIGINSSIRDNIKIGHHVIIGMGAVVTKDIPDNTTVVGNPARRMIE